MRKALDGDTIAKANDPKSLVKNNVVVQARVSKRSKRNNAISIEPNKPIENQT